MKLRHILTTSLLVAALLAANVRVAHGFCVMQAFGDLAARYADIVADVTAWVNLKVEAGKIATANRWSAVALADRESYALLELKGSLGSAEKTAAERGRTIGSQTAQSHLSLVDDDVINSTRTPLNEMGNGVGALAGRGDLNDATLANVLTRTGEITQREPFKSSGYTSAEVLYRLKIIHEANPNIQVGDLFTKLQNSTDVGAVAEVHVAAHLRRTVGLEEMGCDEIPGPLQGLGVDMRTPQFPGQPAELYQVGISGEAIRRKISDEAATTAQNIKLALAQMPAGTKFKFAQVQDAGWKPTAFQLENLNSEPRARGVAELTMDDFVEVHLSTDPPALP